ncbi:MAG: mononuclear molybdenum enzyme YedY, partial [Gammaproteobacteria bacterium]|nr:mononuclear molybdenum enzyme YedY [Gammaproteobacteria bacterium]
MSTRVPRIAPSEITPPEVYFSRRALLAGALATGASSLLRAAEAAPAQGPALSYTANPQYSVKETPNKYEEIAGYNNFYEFGTDKDDPSRNAHTLKTRPWSVNVYGEAEGRGTFDLEDLLKGVPLEERI